MKYIKSLDNTSTLCVFVENSSVFFGLFSFGVFHLQSKASHVQTKYCIIIVVCKCEDVQVFLALLQAPDFHSDKVETRSETKRHQSSSFSVKDTKH
jgi:hypothetical protein